MDKHIEVAQNWARESVNIRKNGSTFPVQLISDVVRNARGQAIAIVITCEDITQRKRAEAALEKQTYELRKRVKELRCLFEISHLIDTEGIPLEEVFVRTVRLLPPAWQYPDILCARILLDNQEFTTANFRETSWKQEHDIFVSNQCVGKIQICYLEQPPVDDGCPFLIEEQDLIRMVAERLSEAIHRRQAEESLRISEEKHRTLFETMVQGVVYQDAAGVIIGANPAAERILGLTLDQMQGRTSFDPRWKAIHADCKYFYAR